MITQEQVELGLALSRAIGYARERAEAGAQSSPQWKAAVEGLESALENCDHYAWDGKARPAKVIGRALAKRGWPEAVIALVVTALGEALAAGRENFRLTTGRGTTIFGWYWKFGGIPGLRSCMTSSAHRHELEVYLEHPELVKLWVLMKGEGEDAQPVARALMWERVRVETAPGVWEDARVLDRVYAVGNGERDKLLSLAKEAGAWVRSVQTYDAIGGDVCLVAPDGRKSWAAEVQLDWETADVYKHIWPYMDTFKFLPLSRSGKITLTTVKPVGEYCRLTTTNGEAVLVIPEEDEVGG